MPIFHIFSFWFSFAVLYLCRKTAARTEWLWMLNKTRTASRAIGNLSVQSHYTNHLWEIYAKVMHGYGEHAAACHPSRTSASRLSQANALPETGSENPAEWKTSNSVFFCSCGLCEARAFRSESALSAWRLIKGGRRIGTADDSFRWMHRVVSELTSWPSWIASRVLSPALLGMRPCQSAIAEQCKPEPIGAKVGKKPNGPDCSAFAMMRRAQFDFLRSLLHRRRRRRHWKWPMKLYEF